MLSSVIRRRAICFTVGKRFRIDVPRGTALPLYLAECKDELTTPEVRQLLLKAIGHHLGTNGCEQNLSVASKLYQEAATRGSSEACNNLAVLKCEALTFRDLRIATEYPSGTEYAQISEYLFEARKCNLPQAWYNLAAIYDARTPIACHDRQRSRFHLEHSASQNFAPAHVLLGFNCVGGQFNSAIEHFNVALQHASPSSYIYNRAQFGLGCVYESAGDVSRAKYCYELAAENRLTEALLQLGWLEVRNDGGLSTQRARGFEKIFEAARTDALAMYSLSAYRLSSRDLLPECADKLSEIQAWEMLDRAVVRGTPAVVKQAANLCNYTLKRYKLARKYYKIAAEMNEPESISNYAIMCLKGIGGPKSVRKALQFIEDGMSQNHSTCFALAAKYYSSAKYGCKPNQRKAGELYLRASQLGSVFGHYFVARFYFEGRGGFPQSTEKAIEHWTKAANANVSQSHRHLAFAHLICKKPNVPLASKHLALALQHEPKDVLLLTLKKSIETGSVYTIISKLASYQSKTVN